MANVVYEPIPEQQLSLARTIDQHVKQVIADGGDDERLLVSMYDYMGSFKQLMDMSTEEEMQLLCARYSGFYRFSKLLEAIAQGIENGSIRVP